MTSTVKVLIFLMISMAIALVTIPGLSMSGKPPQPAYLPDRILVKFNSGVPESRINEIVLEQNCEILTKIDLIDVLVLSIKDNMPVMEKVEEFNDYPEVEYAEPDHRAQTQK